MTDEERQIIDEKVKPIQILETEESITLVFERTGKKLKDGFYITMVVVERLPDGKYRVSGHGVMDFLSKEEEYEKNKAYIEKMLEYFEVKQDMERYGYVYRDIDSLDAVGTEVYRMLACISAVQRWTQMFRIITENLPGQER